MRTEIVRYKISYSFEQGSVGKTWGRAHLSTRQGKVDQSREVSVVQSCRVDG